MCKIWSIIYECRHKDNKTLSVCHGRRKYPNTPYEACMHYPCLRIHQTGKCGPCRKSSADKRFDYESKVIEEYFTSLLPEELVQHADVDAERAAMLQDVERRKNELTNELPLGNAASGSKVGDWMGKYSQNDRPWGSKRRTTWKLSPLANELLPEYIAEPEPHWATNFMEEQPSAEVEQPSDGSVDWAAELAKESEYVSDHSAWEVHDYTAPRDDDASDTTSESSDELDAYDDQDDKDAEEDDDSGFVSEDSMDLDVPDATKMQAQEPADELADAVRAMHLSPEADDAGVDTDTHERTGVHVTSPKALIVFSDAKDTPETSSTESSHTPLNILASVDPNAKINQGMSDGKSNYTTDRASTGQPITTPDTSISACLMEVEGVKYLIGDRPEQATPWQWSRSACSPKKKNGLNNLVIQW